MQAEAGHTISRLAVMHLLCAGEPESSYVQIISVHWFWLLNVPLALFACMYD